MLNVRFVDAVFSPAEAERITGVSPTLQRDWRRRNFLPSFEGHARFTSSDVCHMWALQLLAERGIGPAHSVHYARALSARISGWAMTQRAAWSGDLLAAFGSDEVPPVAAFIQLSNGPLRRFWIVAQNAMATADSVDTYLDTIVATPAAVSAIIVLDVKEMGFELLKRAGRPLVHVEATSE